jgi:hypothetical protein
LGKRKEFSNSGKRVDDDLKQQNELKNKKTLTTIYFEELRKIIQIQNKEMFQEDTGLFGNFMALVNCTRH